MAEKHVISFSMIHEYFKDHSAQLKKGENAYRSGHVTKMVYDGSVQPALLKGDVLASMKKRSYHVEVTVTKQSIVQATCLCPRGKLICHHMAALILYAHYNVSATDNPCTWNAPKSSESEPRVKISDMYPSQSTCGVKRLATEEEIQNFKLKLGNHKVGFTWLLRPSPSSEILTMIPQVEEIFFSQEYLQSTEREQYVQEKLSVNLEKLSMLQENTLGQAANENWLIARKHRLTASKFGGVLAACERNRFPSSLFRNLVEGYNLNSVMAVQWGKNNEATAIEKFKADTNFAVRPSGLWLHECGSLGASPDGLVSDGSEDEAIIEVKCPYKFRNSSLMECLSRQKNYIIYYDEEGTACINSKHNYWHQIQGLLHICKKKRCYLMIWTPKESCIFLVEKDINWGHNIDTLKEFYLKKNAALYNINEKLIVKLYSPFYIQFFKLMYSLRNDLNFK